MPPKIEALVAWWEQRLADFFDGGPFRRGLYSLWVGMRRHNGAKTASAMAFNLFLAGIPTLAFTGWLAAHLLGRSPEALGLISLTMNLTPVELNDLVEKNFQRFGASSVAPIALLGAFWLVSSAFHMLMEVFEVALRTRKRPWWKKRLIAIGCALSANLLFAATIFVTVKIAGGPATILRVLRTGEQLAHPVERGLTIAITLGALTTALAGFFRIAVDRPGLNRRVWPGAVVTVAIGGLASTVFGVYARKLASYTLFYGSLTAVALLLAWLWIWCAALLVGAELNAQLEGGERIAPPSTVRMRLRQAAPRTSGS